MDPVQSENVENRARNSPWTLARAGMTGTRAAPDSRPGSGRRPSMATTGPSWRNVRRAGRPWAGPPRLFNAKSAASEQFWATPGAFRRFPRAASGGRRRDHLCGPKPFAPGRGIRPVQRPVRHRRGLDDRRVPPDLLPEPGHHPAHPQAGGGGHGPAGRGRSEASRPAGQRPGNLGADQGHQRPDDLAERQGSGDPAQGGTPAHGAVPGDGAPGAGRARGTTQHGDLVGGSPAIATLLSIIGKTARPTPTCWWSGRPGPERS